MYTHKDIEHKTIFVINCISKRDLRVSNGELLLEEEVENSNKTKTLTKLPFQKILALFVIGHIRITTPLIEKCQKFGVALVVLKPSLRPVFFWSNTAEANYLLHKRQYDFNQEDVSIAQIIICNKLCNQIKALRDTRKKDSVTIEACETISACLNSIPDVKNYQALMGLEGIAAKAYFSAFFNDFDCKQRKPRTKCDPVNTSLDIGYTILFNYVECFLRMFGFDLYVGILHKCWFKRKSLVCDIMEPFRPIVDKVVRTAWNRNQFSEKDFQFDKGEYRLKHENNGKYCQVFFESLIPRKQEFFLYVQSYYRCFMGRKSICYYPVFQL